MWYNPIIKLLLLSPLHGFASKDILLLEYTGRRSGKKITVPLSIFAKNWMRVSLKVVKIMRSIRMVKVTQAMSYTKLIT